MRRIAIAIAFVLAATPAAAQTPQTPPAAQTVPSTYQLRVAGPTYFTNGDVKGEPLVLAFGKFGEAITIDVISGPTLCDVKTPVRVTGAPDADVQKSAAYAAELKKQGLGPNHPDVLTAQAYVQDAKRLRLRAIDGTTGWRLAITPVREENGALVIEVTWPRPFGFAKGYWLTGNVQAGNVQPRSAQPLMYRVGAQPLTLTLKPGARVLLDRMSVDVAPGSACNAIGMGLEVGVDSSRSTVVESEVWLVHKKPDGSETSEKQVLRTTTGASSAYVFPKAMLGHDVFGQVSPAKTDGTMDVQLAIGRTGDATGAQMKFVGSVTVDATDDSGPFVTMTRVAVRSDNPTEVLSVPLATIRVDDAKAAAKGTHEFSLRIRSKELATNK